MAKLDLTLGIIDGVYPATKWHVGTLSQVVWIVSDKQLPTNNDRNKLWSQSRNDMDIPKEPVDIIVIIGSLNSLTEE